MAKPLDEIEEKLNRSDEHIAELHREIEGFLDAAPYRTLVNADPIAVEAFRALHRERAVPMRFSVIAGEAIYQLRSSLDHLACRLVERGGGKPSLSTQFPIFTHRPTTPKDRGRYDRQICGVRPSAAALIERVQPYQNGDADGHPFAILKGLNNADKHQSLVLHVCAIRPQLYYQLTSIPERISPDESVEAAGERLANTKVEVLDVQKHLIAHIAFPRIGKSVDQPVVPTLQRLKVYTLRAIADFVDEV